MKFLKNKREKKRKELSEIEDKMQNDEWMVLVERTDFKRVVVIT